MSSTEDLERIEQDPDVQKVVAAARAVESLKTNAGWLYLKKRFDSYPELTAQGLAKRILKGERIPQEQIDFVIGYAHAIADVFSKPEEIEKDLERAADKAWHRIQNEEAESTEEPPNQ